MDHRVTCHSSKTQLGQLGQISKIGGNLPFSISGTILSSQLGQPACPKGGFFLKNQRCHSSKLQPWQTVATVAAKADPSAPVMPPFRGAYNWRLTGSFGPELIAAAGGGA